MVFESMQTHPFFAPAAAVFVTLSSVVVGNNKPIGNYHKIEHVYGYPLFQRDLSSLPQPAPPCLLG